MDGPEENNGGQGQAVSDPVVGKNRRSGPDGDAFLQAGPHCFPYWK